MYIILWWKANGNLLTAVKDAHGSIKVFYSLEQADDYVNAHPNSDDLRVISTGAA